MTDIDAPGIGHNNPPLAAEIAATEDLAAVVTDWLRDSSYAGLTPRVTELLAEAAPIVEAGALTDNGGKDRCAALIKKARDLWKEIEAAHDKEAVPYLRGKQAVDQFFFGLMDMLGRRAKTGKAGIGNVLNDMLTAYDRRKLAEERARRDAEARKAAVEEAVRRMAAERAERDAREAAAAAERARKPETQQVKTEAAEQRMMEAAGAKAAAEVAAAGAERAYVDTLAKPADIMRNRSADGTLSTMATESFAEIEDDTLLDRDKLWPFISLDAKEKALRAWAKTTGHGQPMTGARIGKRQKSVVR